MKEGYIVKTGADRTPSPEEMEKIDRYARRELSPGEVYTFSVILCDNEVDRDYERFTVAALKRLAALFVGKTGIFDHNPKGENQTARIYDALVVTDPARRTSAGEPYTCVRASAYMVRSPKTEELILEIDAGIKKEVSVGCRVEKATCSVCGADLRREGCVHRKGETVNGAVCHAVLDCPTDAYEWSFVAVPAQRAAGVTKSGAGEKERSPEQLEKAFREGSEALTLTPAEQRGILEKLEKESGEAALGRRLLREAGEEISRFSALLESEAQQEIVKTLAGRMHPEELLRLRDSYRKRWNDSAASPQLFREKKREEKNENKEFMI